MALEPALVNDTCLDAFLELGGMEQLCRVMAEQKMPKQIANFKYESPFVRSFFAYTIYSLKQAVRIEEGVEVLLQGDQKWFGTLLTILEQWRDEDIIVECTLIMQQVVKVDKTFDILL